MKIIIDGVSFSYNGVTTLDNISLSIDRGKILSILGPNGSGKTTLIKLIASILPIKQGQIFVAGKDLQKMERRDRARLFGYVPQRSEGFKITVFEAVLSGRKPHLNFKVTKEDIDIVENVLRTVGLSEMRSRSILNLSGGEFQKVVIARALAQKPGVLLLDEPLTYLDLKNQVEIAELVSRVTKESSIITILVLHDINLALRYSDTFLLLREGRVHAYGGREIMTKDNIQHVFGVRVDLQELGGAPYVFVQNVLT